MWGEYAQSLNPKRFVADTFYDVQRVDLQLRREVWR